MATKPKSSKTFYFHGFMWSPPTLCKITKSQSRANYDPQECHWPLCAISCDIPRGYSI